MSEQSTDDLHDAGRLLGSELRLVRELTGGEHALTQLATDGVTEHVVRSFPPSDTAVLGEVLALDRVAALRPGVPELRAYDADRARPLIVTSRVEGTTPPPQASATSLATRLARMLARVHALDPTGLPGLGGPRPGTSTPLVARAEAEWTLLEPSDPVLCHGDFWSGNALWSGLELTGLIDWSGASTGPRGFDLAWCRLDLVLLGDPGAADVLVADYERHSEVTVSDLSVWDRQAAASSETLVESWAPRYAHVGRRHLTGPRLRQRFDAWTTHLQSAS